MLLTLSGRGVRVLSPGSDASFVGRICDRTDYPEAARAKEILLVREPIDALPQGFRAYLLWVEQAAPHVPDVYWIPEEMRYLEHGDIVRIEPRTKRLSTLYRRGSTSNTLLVTEQCDNFCLMCSQPPKEHDDSWLVDELRQIIPLISPDTIEIGITGGEPALLGNDLVGLVELLGRFIPRTAVHVLSNGRRFSERSFAESLGQLRHPELMVGIPLYSDLPEEHDFVVQAAGAFDETVRGILNLKRAGIRVELRFVVHRETYARLPEFAEFVARNLLFVDHVALMGLELMGFAKANLDALWIDPLDYQEQLQEAVATLDRAGLVVSVYNHQLCVLAPSLRPFARKSISDWKNMYIDACRRCARMGECGGFFASSALRQSRGISPFA